MGIIIRQSIKQSIVSYVAVLIAAAAQFFIYPIDDLVTYGRAQKMIAVIFLFYPIMSFGLPQALIKFFGDFGLKDKGYLLNFLLLTFGAFVLFGGLLFLFLKPLLGLLNYSGIEGSLFNEYIVEIGLSILILMLFKMLVSNMANYKRIVWPAIFDTLWTKVALGLLVLSIIYGYIDIEWLETGMLIYFAIGLLALVIYTLYLGRLDLKYNPEIFKGENLRQIGSYAGYTGLAAFGATLATRVDSFMAALYVDDQQMGTYAFFLFLASIIDIPARSVSGIASPILSQALSRNDMQEVETVFTKATLNLFLFGIGLYSLIFLSLEDLISWMGKRELLLPYVIIFMTLGLVKVMQATLSTCGQIVLYSKHYKVMLYLTLMMGMVNIILNYIFITDVFIDQKIVGIAYATALSIGLYLTFLVIYVAIKFDMNPFQPKLFYGLLCVLVCFGVAHFMPLTTMPLLNIAIRSVLFALPFLYLIYRLRLSADINAIIDLVIEKIKNRDFKNLI